MRLFILTALAAAGTSTAQMPEVVLRTTTRLVQVNVIVTRHGAAVPGLKKEDFQVFDNGQAAGDPPIFRGGPGDLAFGGRAATPRHFHQSTRTTAWNAGGGYRNFTGWREYPFSDQTYARQQVLQFLKQIQPEDRIAIYTLDSRGLRVLHDYTTGSADLLAKLTKYQADIVPDITGVSEVGDPLGGFLGRGGDGNERVYYLNNRIQETLRSIEFIAHNLSFLPGRKNLIWISAAFPLQIGFMPNSGGGRSGAPPASLSGRPGTQGMAGMNTRGFPSTPRQQQTWTYEADRTVRALNNANLATYPVDARGLVASASSRTASRVYNNQATMEELASRTGGRAFVNSNDIAGAIRTAVEDSSITYTLGFYPENDKFDNSFHNLKVKLVDFPHLDLCYRKGYLDQSTPPQDEGLRRAALADAVLSPMDANGMGLRANVHGTAAGFDVTLRVDPRSILLDPQGDRRAGKIDVLFVEKDEHGAQTYGVDDTVSIQLKKPNYDRLQQDGLMYHRVLPHTGKASEIRVVVRDASTGAVGSVTAAISAIPAQP